MSLSEEVRGYRAVRYPKMENAIQTAEIILAGKEVPQSGKPTSSSKELSKV